MAITKPVFGYAADALGLRILTPHSFPSLAIGGVDDPAPQDVQSAEERLFNRQSGSSCFFYNQQAVAADHQNNCSA